MLKQRECQDSTETRQRDQSVQRPQGKSVPGVPEDQQGVRCSWSGLEGTLGEDFLMDSMWRGGRGGSMINDTRIGRVALTETGKSRFQVVGGEGRDEFWTC